MKLFICLLFSLAIQGTLYARTVELDKPDLDENSAMDNLTSLRLLE